MLTSQTAPHREASKPGSEPPQEQDRGRAWSSVVLLAVLAAAVGHRLQILASTDFPINDGGLFVPYIEASRTSFPGLPDSIAYNGLDLPFAYPPLAFWLGGLLGMLGVGPVTVLHVLPILMNAVWIVLLALLLLRDGHSRLFTAAAVAVVAVAFRSYEYLVMGGGLTRGLGAIFLVLTLLALGSTRGRESAPLPLRSAVLAGLCVAGAILSHLEWGILAAAVVVVQRVLCSQSARSFLISSAIAGGTALAIVLPWVLIVASRHGLEPFLAASETSSWNLAETAARLEGFTRAQWPNLLMAVGAVILLARRHPFWLIFIVLCLVLTPRHSLTPLVIPIGYLTACGLEGVVAAVRRAGAQWREVPEVAAVLALAVVAVIPSAVAVDRTRTMNPEWDPLSEDVRAAMAWVRAEHAGSSFAVVTDPVWHLDSTAEWFPELTRATSSTTVQGTEWLPGDAFGRRDGAVLAMKTSPTCEDLVQRALAIAPVEFVWTETRTQCFDTPQFRRVFSNAEVMVFSVA